MKHLSTTILLCALLLLPLAAIAEHADLKVWNERLAWPNLEPEPDRHTPRYTDGTLLPPTITGDVVLTAADNPVLLPSTTRIERGASLTLMPGTLIAAHEFAALQVAGTLTVNGSDNAPVVFASNELHPENQVWNGIMAEENSKVSVTQAHFRQAEPALACQRGATAQLTNVVITARTLGLFTASQTCAVTGSTIRSARDGIIAVGVKPSVSNTNFFVAQHDIKYVRTFQVETN